VTPEGKTKIGPTAIPAFWRENYGGLAGLDLTELAEIGARNLRLFRDNQFDFRRLAVTELAKYSRRRMAHLASSLADGISAKHFRRWGPPGIRAQLFDLQTQRLEMDFRFEGDERSFHVLNAVSPAFTCSFPFAEFVFDQVDRLVAGHPAPLNPTAPFPSR
jgi:(S)-2-hydroxyglutarate dehydrogenase